MFRVAATIGEARIHGVGDTPVIERAGGKHVHNRCDLLAGDRASLWPPLVYPLLRLADGQSIPRAVVRLKMLQFGLEHPQPSQTCSDVDSLLAYASVAAMTRIWRKASPRPCRPTETVEDRHRDRLLESLPDKVQASAYREIAKIAGAHGEPVGMSCLASWCGRPAPCCRSSLVVMLDKRATIKDQVHWQPCRLAEADRDGERSRQTDDAGADQGVS
jgi:hypothetical protein